MQQDFLSTVAAEMDAETLPAGFAARGPVAGVGSMVGDVMRQLRASGIPWLLIFKVLPLVLGAISEGKTVAEIVKAVLDALASGLFG